jgi:RNA polymerase sigma factor (sigma-70 family)
VNVSSIDDLAARVEQSQDVVSALKELPLALRVVVVLRYFADLSEREIAIAIGRQPGTVKSRLNEARKRLAASPALRATPQEQSPTGEEATS